MSEDVRHVLDRADWSRPGHETGDLWRGRFDGDVFGAQTSVIFYSTDEIGAGPKLHHHPYDEIFILRRGHARFTVGDRRFEAGEGQVVFGPAGVPHKFVNLGPGPLETIDIHIAPRIVQFDLE
ncbi:MAG: cupin domain-containing protein [Methylobacteriaceae bacterium]|nr:cupin domain-containing protein [Methylobacteriaceae bacterium]